MGRPHPPTSLLEPSALSEFGIRLVPAPEVWSWIQLEILADTGSIHNEDHVHLPDADIRVMWASSGFEKQGRTVLGQAEQVAAVHIGGLSDRYKRLCTLHIFVLQDAIERAICRLAPGGWPVMRLKARLKAACEV